MRVNLPSRIQQVRVPIWRVIQPIRGLLNPIRQVVLLISLLHLYPPYRFHLLLHPPSSVSNSSGLEPNRRPRSGSATAKQPDPLTLGVPQPDPYPPTCGFCPVWLDPSVPISGSAFRVSHLWLHSDMLLIIVQ